MGHRCQGLEIHGECPAWEDTDHLRLCQALGGFLLCVVLHCEVLQYMAYVSSLEQPAIFVQGTHKTFVILTETEHSFWPGSTCVMYSGAS